MRGGPSPEPHPPAHAHRLPQGLPKLQQRLADVTPTLASPPLEPMHLAAALLFPSHSSPPSLRPIPFFAPCLSGRPPKNSCTRFGTDAAAALVSVLAQTKRGAGHSPMGLICQGAVGGARPLPRALRRRLGGATAPAEQQRQPASGRCGVARRPAAADLPHTPRRRASRRRTGCGALRPTLCPCAAGAVTQRCQSASWVSLGISWNPVGGYWLHRPIRGESAPPPPPGPPPPPRGGAGRGGAAGAAAGAAAGDARAGGIGRGWAGGSSGFYSARGAGGAGPSGPGVGVKARSGTGWPAERAGVAGGRWLFVAPGRASISTRAAHRALTRGAPRATQMT
jgi:hypothetical protein